jgi:hypothetical protein
MAEEKAKTFDWKRFVKVQQSLPNVGKDGKGNYGSYMKLEDLNPALLKVLNDNGFVWVTMPVYENGTRCLQYTLVDTVSGASIGGVMDLVMAQDTPQAQGSAITYARRYTLTAVTGLVADMDDDGQQANDSKEAQNLNAAQIATKFADVKSKADIAKVFNTLNATEKKLAVPVVQEKMREVTSD